MSSGPKNNRQMTAGWHQRFAQRLVYLWPLKAVGTSVFMTLFFWGYFSILRAPLTTPVEMPLIWLDRWVGFSPAAFPVYVSLWVYVSLPPALMGSFRSLASFGAWVGALSVFCLMIFWVWPTAVPVAGVDWTLHAGLSLIKGVDAGGNACPSLHVGSAVFAAFWLDRICRELDTPPWLRVANPLYCLAIAWSTMATLQHVALDVLAGALVGTLFALASLHYTRKLT